MALVNIDSALHDALRILKSSPTGGGVEIMSYKRNRTIALINLGSAIGVREKGYLVFEKTFSEDQLTKWLKGAIKREFPRSRKVRLAKFHQLAELERIHQKI